MPDDDGKDFTDIESKENESRSPEVVYNPEKDFYKGIGGEFRYKAEGLFKKAKEKGISIEEISINTMKENGMEFPGIGTVDLPAYVVKVKGRDIQTGQTMVDGKQIDYYNRYQTYMADRIENKNFIRDERGRVVRENNKPRLKQDPDLSVSEWERFEIGKSIVEDKEFGLEKTITGACDRVIRKLMGENDWLQPDEARLLDEEFNNVQESIIKERDTRKTAAAGLQKKATDRQINYLKARIRNAGLDPENSRITKEIIRQAGFGVTEPEELSSGSMSKVIDSFNDLLPRVKEALAKTDGIVHH